MYWATLGHGKGLMLFEWKNVPALVNYVTDKTSRMLTT